MNAASSPLERVVAKYRRDVHQLAQGAAPDALSALEGHLGKTIPVEWRRFLCDHNGAQLFRGSLTLRSTSEISQASAACPEVVLFADGVDWTASATGKEGARIPWGYAFDDTGKVVLGTWNGQRLQPTHGTFGGWLAAELALLEARVHRTDDVDAIRFEADPEDAVQLAHAGVRALKRGASEEAEKLLSKATQRDPRNVEAWQRLGDALAATDRSAARKAWLQAFRSTVIPLPYPGAPCLDIEVLRPLSLAFADVEAWEKELVRFIAEQVRDVRREVEVEVLVAVSTALCRSLLRRGRRREGRDVLGALLSKARTTTHATTPWESLLELVRLEIDLGNHDEAEALLRRLRTEGPSHLQGEGHVQAARIAVMRQEPWAEEILDEAMATGLSDEGRILALLLRIERVLRIAENPAGARKLYEEALELHRKVSTRSLQGQLALAEGDLLKAEGKLPLARAAWQKGLSTLGDAEDPDTRFRIQLRLGDLAMSQHKPDQAWECWRGAAEGFGAHELPLREGWAWLRMARIAQDREPLLARARERFTDADLAAGVAAADALSGDPGASLHWHLDRATAQARARHHAQRSRPPWSRADADRPERRLGAHRLAVAACNDGIVEAIAAEMNHCARAMSSGRTRASDPPVLRYIAAVDLLSGHRSYSAAKILLQHLLQQSVEGPARRALQNAMARSPNAALVDGLLTCIERPHENPGHAVAAAAELLGMRREPESKATLLKLSRPGSSPVARRAAIAALGRIGHKAAVPALLEALEEPLLAEQAALALLMLGDRRGVDFHGRALAEHRLDLSGHPGEIVGRYGGPQYILLLQNASDGVDDRALGALQGLGLLGDPRVVPTLLKALSAKSSQAVAVAAGALQILTGHEENLEDHGFKNRWHAWWDKNRENFQDGVRYRDGKWFDVGLLLDKMEHPDGWLRRTAYDELVILTGTDLSFDAEGPWRVQVAHLRAWRQWWAKHRSHLKAGRWYLCGEPIT